MEKFNKFVNFQLNLSLIFLGLGLLFGLLYSLFFVGININSTLVLPQNLRSLHISLMLYGFVPLMLSFLPFLIINKEVGTNEQGLKYLNLYTIFWYIFLIFMIVSLLFGNTRGLAFYDFPYELNFILALSGVFYIIALYKFIKQYKVIPLWIKVCLKVVIVAPIALLILMNPVIGQVESTITGPHGDNTLGMSLALIPIYYLIFKLLNNKPFVAKWNILWIIPMVFYFGSVLYRSFYEPLTYNQEWFLQYLTLLYVPLLYKWYKDSEMNFYPKLFMLISILAFLFVDIEGNIIFIPEIRWMFHRNDLIVAHAHVAMGIGVFFMVIAMFSNLYKPFENKNFIKAYVGGLLGIFTVLSINGFIQAKIIEVNSEVLMILRSLFGVVVISSILFLIKFKTKYTIKELYNIGGVLNDGLGGIFLIFFAGVLYPLIGFSFEGKYEYVVFSFVIMTGLIHLMSLIYKEYEYILTNLTALIRVFMSATFFALYSANILGIEALIISLFDITYASIYFIFIHKSKEIECNK